MILFKVALYILNQSKHLYRSIIKYKYINIFKYCHKNIALKVDLLYAVHFALDCGFQTHLAPETRKVICQSGKGQMKTEGDPRATVYLKGIVAPSSSALRL